MQILFGLNLPFSFFAFDANFLFCDCVIHYFGLEVSLVFVGSQVLICVDIIVLCWLHHYFNFVVLLRNLMLIQFVLEILMD